MVSESLVRCFEEIDKRQQDEIDKDVLGKNIYQYMNFEALKNILKERKLRYTHYNYFNDPTEIKYGLGIISEALMKIINKKGFPNLLRERTHELFKMLNQQDHKFYVWYVCCFSMEIEKLSLWRYYAANGTGFAIGITSFYSTQSSEGSFDRETICKVKYGEEGKEIIEQYVSAYEKEQTKPEDYCELITQLLSNLPKLKDESFRDEHEVRRFYCEGEGILDNDGKPFYFEEEKRGFTDLRSCNIPFISELQDKKKPYLIPNEFSKEDIKEIWIGPACDYEKANKKIQSLLKMYGYDLSMVEIKKSELPFRMV